MGLFTLEHGKAAYRAGFALYGAAVVVLTTFHWARAQARHKPLPCAAGHRREH